MNQPYYQEKFKIGQEAIGPGFDPAKRVAGDGDSNLKYIYSETGANVTVRGRGSGYIEPRMGRESSDPLHVLVQHDSSYEAFQKACRLVQDLIETVKEDWDKLQGKETQPQGKQDFYWQEEKPGSSRSVSHSDQKDERERRDFRGEEVRVHRGEGRDWDQNFKGLYDDRREMEDIQGDRESGWRGNVWGASRDSVRNSHVEDNWLRGRDYQDKRQRSLEPEDHLKRGQWQTANELGLVNRCQSDELEKRERPTSSTRQLSNKWGDKNWTPEDNWSGRNQQEERKWNDSGLREENLNRSNEKQDELFWDSGLQKEKLSREIEEDYSRTKWPWYSGLQEEKISWRNEKEDDKTERQSWDGGLQKEKMSRWNKNDGDRSERSRASGLQEEKLGNYKEGSRFRQPWDEKMRAQKDKNKDHQDLGNKKKSRWDKAAVEVKGASVVPDKNVIGLVLDQKKYIEEKLEKRRKGSVSFGNFEPLTAPLLNSVPLEINQNQLQNLNHRQLLQISQQQQSLLLHLSANLIQQGPLQALNTLSSNSLTNLQVNPMLNFPSNPLYNFQPLNPVPSVVPEATMPVIAPPFRNRVSPELMSERFDRKQILEEDSNKDYNKYLWTGPSTSRRQSPPRQWQEKEKPTYSEKERKKQRSERSSRSPMFRNSPSRRSSPFPRNSSPHKSSSIKNSEFSPPPRKNSQLQTYSPYEDIPPRRLSPRGGNERYSPQLNDGQERYSPQLEEDFKMRSPELYSRREDHDMCKSKKQTLEEKRRKKLLRFRVAVINKKFDKLTPQDEEEIKFLVYKELNTLPISCAHDIDFLGFGSQDYVFVLMPHSLEAMKWLVNIKHLESMSRSYTLFPYEDIYNKFRMKSILYFDLLEGYRPNPEEVILELGRMNSGLCTEMWKAVKFIEEQKGFFLEISVDFLSYLQLRKLQWKPYYRLSSIRLEPVKSDQGIDERFNKRLRV